MHTGAVQHFTQITSVDDQAAQVIGHIKDRYDGHLDCAFGLSLGGKILSRVLERDEVTIDHAILDAAPLLPLPKWLVGPLLVDHPEEVAGRILSLVS